MVDTGGSNGENDEEDNGNDDSEKDGKNHSENSGEEGVNHREKDEENDGEDHCVGLFWQDLNQSGESYEQRHKRISSWESYPISRAKGLGVVQLNKLRKE